jgi:DNA-directed RNA polymerase subunit M/transcription elongation factor TFIIS
MQIIAQCPACKTGMLLDSAAADRRITCRKCGLLFKVPKLEEISKAVKVIETAAGEVYVDEDGKIFG